jgi:hypothetical protein
MLKVIKRYSMPLKRSTAVGSKISNVLSLISMYYYLGATIAGADVVFSSYPGTLHSVGA